MGSFTNKLKLYKPGGGSTGLITPPEQADIDKINANMDLIDAAYGAVKVTSGTHPASPIDGMTIHESDTQNTLIWSDDVSRWIPVGIPNVSSDAQRGSYFPSPIQGTMVNRVDKGYYERYCTLYNSSTNPKGAKTAGWYPNGVREVDTTVVGAVMSGYVIDTEGTYPGAQAYAATDGDTVWLRMRIKKSSGNFSHAVPFFLISDPAWLPKKPGRYQAVAAMSGTAGSATATGLVLQGVGGTGDDKENWNLIVISPPAQQVCEFSLQYQLAGG